MILYIQSEGDQRSDVDQASRCELQLSIGTQTCASQDESPRSSRHLQPPAMAAVSFPAGAVSLSVSGLRSQASGTQFNSSHSCHEISKGCVIEKQRYLYGGCSPIVALGIFFPCTSRTYIEDRNWYREVVQQRQGLRLYFAGTGW